MENGCGCPRAGRDVEGSTPGLDEIELESTVYRQGDDQPTYIHRCFFSIESDQWCASCEAAMAPMGFGMAQPAMAQGKNGPTNLGECRNENAGKEM